MKKDDRRIFIGNECVSRILTINSGPSSIKFALYHMGKVERAVLSGSVMGFGFGSGMFHIKDSDGKIMIEKPLPENVDGNRYRDVLNRALKRIVDFQPRFLIVALGLDPEKKDPTGSWILQALDFKANGRMIGFVRFPTLVVQEGGYNNRVLGMNARHFFVGLWSGAYSL